MKILVTGGAGFIGSSLIEELLKRGDSVTCVDNFSNYYDVRFKKENIRRLKNRRLRVLNIDIEDRARLIRLLKGYRFDKVVHLAARVGVRNSLKNPDLYIKTNIAGTLNVLEAAREMGVKDIVFAGSSSVYGNDAPIPSKEDEPCLKPLNPYAMSKRSAELLCYTYHTIYGLNVTVLRFFTVYGPKGRPDMSPYIFTESLLKGKKINLNGDGRATRDFTNIKDIVRGIMLALAKPFGYEIINLGASRPVSIKKFISVLEKITGKKAKINYRPKVSGESRNTYADTSKAKKLLGFESKITLEAGLTKFVDWFRANRLV